MLEIGAIVGGKLRIERILGRGGMGIVAIATHVQLEQRVAIKVLHEHLASDPATVERFLREARTPMRMRSDHVCRVLDIGQLDDGAMYIVMELLDGCDLAALVKSRGPLPIETAADYLLQACIAIAEAHALGIVHRDLKPANLFLTRRLDGSPLVKVLDFGIAKLHATGDITLTHTSAVMGSPGYMSPEQLRSAKDVDARTDLWAIGSMLYELVSGRLPFPADNVAALAFRVASEPPEPLDVDPAFRAIVFRCLEKDPARRYQDVGELARDLARFAGAGAGASAALIGKLLERTADTQPAPPPSGGGNIATQPTTLQSAAGQPNTLVKRPRRGLAIPAGVALALAAAVLGGYELASRGHDQVAAARPLDAAATIVSPPVEVVVAEVPIDVAVPIDAAVPHQAPAKVTPAPRRPPPPADAAEPQFHALGSAEAARPPETDGDFSAEARELAMVGDWNELKPRALAVLARSPKDPVALYYIVDAACSTGDEATAHKYAPLLSPKVRHELAQSPCSGHDIELE